MAEWIKFEANTPEKAEVLSITALMGWDDPDLTVGKLLRIWRWFDQQTINGNATGVTPALLDRIAGVSGFVNAMSKVGWIVINEEEIRLPNFDRHNGKTAKDRALTAKRVLKHKTNAAGNGAANGDGVTLPLPRKEKKRKELNTVSKETITKVAELYNELLPDLPAAKLVTTKRSEVISEFFTWVLTSLRSDGKRRAENDEQAIEWIGEYFRRANLNDFVMGRTPKVAGHENWRADLEYVMSDKGKTQIIEKTKD